MTDQELLEKAAKAAGMTIGTAPSCTLYWSHVQMGFFLHGTNVGYEWPEAQEWNPLDNDGDALRLAVKLRLSVYLAPSGALMVISGHGEVRCDEFGDDWYAATRRAIVRAAANLAK